MGKEGVYTSTGMKLLHHPKVVSWLLNRRAIPVSLQVSPTSRCSLNCMFCSNVNRNKDEELKLNELDRILGRLVGLGLKTVEWTGGGDPTLYKNINEAIRYASSYHLKQGFITNGIFLKEALTEKELKLLFWVRVSMNSLDYVDEVVLPEIPGVLGFSYVMNERTNAEVLWRLQDHVDKYKPEYVRVVPNCQATDEEQKKNNLKYSQFVERMGVPYFYQAKTFSKPKHCWWCYFKPFINHDGWVYPCSSVVLNLGADLSFHEKFRWCRMEDLIEMYTGKMESFNTINCNHCVFKAQNDVIESVMNPDGMEDFV